MMVLLAIALVLIGVMVGGAGMRRFGRLTKQIVGPWRPGVAVAGLICLLGAGALAVRGAVLEAGVLAVVGLTLAIWARRRAPRAAESIGMPSREARRILGVADDADRVAIEAAYRRLMQRAHPDLGGTSGLAAQLNAARDALVKSDQTSA